jgi:LuxR family maltose regulon positive regulatory protein
LRLTPHLYVPQLTLAKVWLTEDTPNSRQEAAELLERLHGLAVSMHNTRVRIDVLALQAWLHDVQGDEPAALEKLTNALALAEPGGFIRAFVDLGLPMANLLNRLLKRHGHAAYIEALLAAFGTAADPVMLAASAPPGTSPAVISAPPLVEPLTTRELDILELLAQRYQDKEIAAQLCIAPTTVKTHLKHLYQKLRVNTRRQAVTQGQALGLLTHR